MTLSNKQFKEALREIERDYDLEDGELDSYFLREEVEDEDEDVEMM